MIAPSSDAPDERGSLTPRDQGPREVNARPVHGVQHRRDLHAQPDHAPVSLGVAEQMPFEIAGLRVGETIRAVHSLVRCDVLVREVLVLGLPAWASDQLEREQLAQRGLVVDRQRPRRGSGTQDWRALLLHLGQRPLDIVDPAAVGSGSAVEAFRTAESLVETFFLTWPSSRMPIMPPIAKFSR